MIQVVEMTRDERVAMYMKLAKSELVEMLINVNEELDRITTRGNSEPIY